MPKISLFYYIFGRFCVFYNLNTLYSAFFTESLKKFPSSGTPSKYALTEPVVHLCPLIKIFTSLPLYFCNNSFINEKMRARYDETSSTPEYKFGSGISPPRENLTSSAFKQSASPKSKTSSLASKIGSIPTAIFAV